MAYYVFKQEIDLIEQNAKRTTTVFVLLLFVFFVFFLSFLQNLIGRKLLNNMENIQLYCFKLYKKNAVSEKSLMVTLCFRNETTAINLIEKLLNKLDNRVRPNIYGKTLQYSSFVCFEIRSRNIFLFV